MSVSPSRHRLHAGLIWTALAAALAVPLILATQSPLLAWRQPVYILAGFAGILGLGLLLAQALLISGALPGLAPVRARRVHRIAGATLVLSVLLHIAGLWLTSPPDVIDALLFRAPTVFSPLGVIAMWALFGAAALALLRHRLGPRKWRAGHLILTGVAIAATAGHALLIEGTMEPLSKAALCLFAVAAYTYAARPKRRPAAKPRP